MASQIKNLWVTKFRDAVQKILEGFEEAKGLDVEWDALDYSNTLVNGDIGIDNALITAQEVKDAVQAVRDLRSATGAGNNVDAKDTTLYKVHRR